MSDFLKIFLFIGAVATAFVFGRGYGEKTFKESDDYKEFVKEKEELNYAKNEFENAKAKLQNVVDSANTKKTDELLGQILQIFLADLGLRIQNRDLILKQAQLPQPSAPAFVARPAEPVVAEQPPSSQPPAAQQWSKAEFSKFKSFEWMISNSDGAGETLRVLNRLKLKNLNQASGDFNYPKEECENFLGNYRGDLNDTRKKRLGSLSFELRTGNIDSTQSFYGSISFLNEAISRNYTEKIGNNCGQKIKGLTGRIFNLTSDRYIQVYKLSSSEKLAGNFYEVLPNGTTHPAGSFILSRTDKF